MLEGAMEPKTIADRAAKLGFPAVALVDRNGLYGAMPFSDACFAEGALARLIADGQQPKAEAYLDRLNALFPQRLYIELSRRHDTIETAAESGLIDLGYACGLPLVATNPAAYSDPSFHAAHDAMLC